MQVRTHGSDMANIIKKLLFKNKIGNVLITTRASVNKHQHVLQRGFFSPRKGK